MKNIKKFLLFFNAAAIIFLGFVSFKNYQLLNNLGGKNENLIENRVKLTVKYIKNAQLSSGLFLYDYDVLKGEQIKKNILARQAGTAAALGYYYDITKDKSIKPVLKNFLNGIKTYSRRYKNAGVIGFHPKITRSGTTALAFLAALYYGEDKKAIIDLRRALLAFLRPDGGFESTMVNHEESPYYNGEAWLALAIYNKKFPQDKKMAKILRKVDDHMIKKYEHNFEVGFFHWGMMAAAHRYQTTKGHKFFRFSKNMFYASKFAKKNYRVPLGNTCYSMEGLGIALNTFAQKKEEQKWLKDMKRVFDMGSAHNKKMQILWEDVLRYGSKLEGAQRFHGAFRNSLYTGSVRIDYAQHCLGAMLEEYQLSKK